MNIDDGAPEWWGEFEERTLMEVRACLWQMHLWLQKRGKPVSLNELFVRAFMLRDRVSARLQGGSASHRLEIPSEDVHGPEGFSSLT